MLTELYCDKFMDGGQKRPPIRFQRGLNAIVGSATGKNSIGKSTILLVTDFAFGGGDYIRLSVDVFEQVVHHRVCHTFKFGNTCYRFSRHTNEPNVVWKCAEDFSEIEEMSLTAYTAWLGVMYGTNVTGGSFRELTSGFFRIYGRKNLDEAHPLYAHDGDTMRGGINRLIKLYNRFHSIEELEAKAKSAVKEGSAFTDAARYGYVRIAKNKTKYKENQHRICELNDELDEITRQSAAGFTDLDAVVAEEAADLRSDLSQLRRQRTILRSRLKLMEDDCGIEKTNTTRDFKSLLVFFPEVDLHALEEIESFHSQITSVLRKEHKEASAAVREQIEELDESISELERRLNEMSLTPVVPIATLKRYARLSEKKSLLINANEGYSRKAKLDSCMRDAKKNLQEQIKSTLSFIETDLNARLDELNVEVCDASRRAPVMSIRDSTHYLYEIPNDGGAGSRTRGMFLLDVALLEGTSLPAIAHDTNAIKQVEDDTMVSLLKVYARQRKQVFLAIDKTAALTNDGEPQILSDATVLRLDENHELFGFSWARKDEAEDRNSVQSTD